MALADPQIMEPTTKPHSAVLDRRYFLRGTAALGALSLGTPLAGALPESSAPPASATDREAWITIVRKISWPVLDALSQRRLKALMPVEAPHGNQADRRQYTHLEALGRLLCGLAPWLESGPGSGPGSGPEGELRNKFADWSRLAIQSATDPASPDFMNFNRGGQPVVDTAFLALAILRAPQQLWAKLDRQTQHNVIAALQSSRQIRPPYNNWLLFSATVEAALSIMDVWWDPMRVDYAIRTIDTWYKGDGVYGDGPEFHWDYYNSFVIQPMLLAVLDTVSKVSPAWDVWRAPALLRAQRYAAIQERLIAPDASFPPIGRSLCYRFGAFHLLADIALRRQLPDPISPQQVRSALTAVMRRMTNVPGTFDPSGWLQIGFCGHQPSMAEPYISTGSLYLCSAAWLPLGLPPTDPFWSGASTPWTQKKAWSGEQVPTDHALAHDMLQHA